MPILPEESPLDAFANRSDPGLEYLIAQKWWPFRRAHFQRLVDAFYEQVRVAPHNFVRQKEHLLSERLLLHPDWSLLESKSILSVLARRRSIREVRGSRIYLTQLATWLMASFGQQKFLPGADSGRDWQRPVPSPGGLFASEVYFLAQNIEGLPPGLYHFCPEDAALEKLDLPLATAEIASIFPDPVVVEQSANAAGMIFITSIFSRMRRKYHHRYLRFALLEAGSLLQNLELVGSGLDFGLWHQGSVDESLVCRLLQINGLDEAVVHSAMLLDRQS